MTHLQILAILIAVALDKTSKMFDTILWCTQRKNKTTIFIYCILDIHVILNCTLRIFTATKVSGKYMTTQKFK